MSFSAKAQPTAANDTVQSRISALPAEAESSGGGPLKRAGAVWELIVGRAALLGSFALLATVFTTTYEVVMRYVFKRPTAWTLELTTYLMVFSVFSAAAYTLKEDSHIKLDVLLLRLPANVRNILQFVTACMALLFALFLTWATGVLTWRMYRVRETAQAFLDLPIFPVYLMMPLGSLLLSVQCLLRVGRAAGVLLQSRPDNAGPEGSAQPTSTK